MNRHDIFAATAAVIILAGCSKSEKNYQVEPLKVTTETVCEGASAVRKHYVGKVEEDSSTPVSFIGMGTVNRVYVEEGQYVAKGQLIAEMDPTQCENTRQAAKASLDQALDAQQRMQVLHESQSISDIDWVNVQTKVRQAQSSLDMANRAIQDCRLLAPCSGIVGKKEMESGMTAMPSQPVCTILNIAKVKVKVSVPEKEIAFFNPHTNKGKGVTVSAEALGGKTFRSTHFIRDVQGDVMTHTYDVRFTVLNPSLELLPGMVVNVTTDAEDSHFGNHMVTVPVRCVQQSADDRQFVWLAKDGKAHRQPVEVGQAEDDRIIIIAGLAEGDKVIVEGYQKVSEGSDVKE
ncbi:MAG: efflux RND transporter periplasmic adaptor subunit [Bacteroidaceae bacterium]|nr:efflux RND transporter periplasmic adaptor subunit [Bacteroidaceae bacterium]